MSGNGELVLSCRGLTVRYGRRTVLDGVNLDLPATGVTAILGPSGSGKSTLLRALNRLLDLTPLARVEGRVTFKGVDVYSPATDPDALRRRIGMVFQRPVIFPTSVRENVLFGLRHMGLVDGQDPDLLAIEALGLAGLLEEVRERMGERASKLSVGQRQRLALARTLSLDPEMLLMDEPTSALDPRSTASVEQTVLSLARGRPIVLVTHSRDQAERLAGQILELRDGKLLDTDTGEATEIVSTSPRRPCLQ